MDEVSRAQDLIGSNVYDEVGSRIGRVDNVFVDDATHQPEWVTVRTGFFGTRESFVPLAGASTRPDGLTVTVSKDKVKTAPRIEIEDGHLSTGNGHDLYSHYGLRHAMPDDESPDQVENAPEQQITAEQPVVPEQATVPEQAMGAEEQTAPEQQLGDYPGLADELVGRHRRED